MTDEKNPHPDITRSTALVPVSHREAVNLARVISGDLPPNRGLFWCMTCGFEKDGASKFPKGLTLHFDEDELAALSGDPYSHQGPCPVCNAQTLVDYAMMSGDHFSIRGQASVNRKKEYGEAADVFFEKAGEKLGAIMGGVMPGSTLNDPSPPPSSGPSRDHLPEADDVDLSDMKPRKG